MVSKSQVDKLGERLKAGALQEDDLRLLDEYRRAAQQAYLDVTGRLKSLGFELIGRSAKSTQSIVDKLKRERCRLSQVQDIAGCRLVVRGALDQDTTLDALVENFPHAVLHDRRRSPSHGYRAVHLIVRAMDLPVEIQIRTRLQHGWAEMSERLADKHGSALKYGGGDPEIRILLVRLSEMVGIIEDRELAMEAEPGTWGDTLALRENLLSTLQAMSQQLSQE